MLILPSPGADMPVPYSKIVCNPHNRRHNNSMEQPPQRPPLPDQNWEDRDSTQESQQTGARQQRKSSARKQKDSGGKESSPKDRKPGKLRKQAMPILIMTGMIVGLFLLYGGVRTAREALGPQAPRTTTLPKQLGKIKLGYPEGWTQKRMDNVARASGRWGMGKPGSTRYAFFITRYPLRAEPRNKAQVQQVLLEAQYSLRNTGASGRKLQAKRIRVAKQSAWYYRFQAQQTDIQIWLILHKSDKRTSLYQFSCQSPPGSKGKSMRQKCLQAIDGLRF